MPDPCHPAIHSEYGADADRRKVGEGLVEMQQGPGERNDLRVVQEFVSDGEEKDRTEARRSLGHPTIGIIAGRVDVQGDPVCRDGNLDRSYGSTFEVRGGDGIWHGEESRPKRETHTPSSVPHQARRWAHDERTVSTR